MHSRPPPCPSCCVHPASRRPRWSAGPDTVTPPVPGHQERLPPAPRGLRGPPQPRFLTALPDGDSPARSPARPAPASAGGALRWCPAAWLPSSLLAGASAASTARWAVRCPPWSSRELKTERTERSLAWLEAAHTCPQAGPGSPRPMRATPCGTRWGTGRPQVAAQGLHGVQVVWAGPEGLPGTSRAFPPSAPWDCLALLTACHNPLHLEPSAGCPHAHSSALASGGQAGGKQPLVLAELCQLSAVPAFGISVCRLSMARAGQSPRSPVSSQLIMQGRLLHWARVPHMSLWHRRCHFPS